MAVSGPATELLHSPQVLLAPVEGAARGPWLEGAVFSTAHRYHRGAEGGDQRDGLAAGLHLMDRRPDGHRISPSKCEEEKASGV